MGGIAGIVRRDGGPVDPHAIASVSARMRHRAIDGEASWIDGCCGLAKQLFRTSPWDPPAARVEANDRYALLFDGRIANRRELWRALSRSEASPGTDAELALAGWLAWGEQLPERLVGDFALAVWDRTERTLFLARDAMGVRPLFVLEWGQVFAFASEPAAFFGLPGWRGEPDEAGVAEYLAFEPARSPRTLLQGVTRLLAGECLTLGGGGARRRLYWTGEGIGLLRLSDGECAERFREVFTEAVRSSLETVGPAGAHLSGGLDSSSIVCVGAGLAPELETFSMVFPGRDCDESAYIDAVIAKTGLRSHRLPPTTRSLADVIEETDATLDVAIPPNAAMSFGLRRAVRERGIRVVLSGEGGDEWFFGDPVASRGALATARAGHFRELLRFYRPSAVASGLWHAVTRSRRLAIPRRMWRAVSPRALPPAAPVPPWLSASLAARAGRVLSETSPHGPIHEWTLIVQEIVERTASRCGFEERHPFYDRRLVELALAIPDYQLARGGAPKWILRQGLGGILPEAVRNRRDKSNFNWVIPGAVAPLEGLLPELSVVRRGWVDPVVARSVLDRVVRTGEWEGVRLWTVLALELWCRALERTDQGGHNVG